ncbi:hypothetical protein D3C86_1737560 [compost metagenome]
MTPREKRFERGATARLGCGASFPQSSEILPKNGRREAFQGALIELEKPEQIGAVVLEGMGALVFGAKIAQVILHQGGQLRDDLAPAL